MFTFLQIECLSLLLVYPTRLDAMGHLCLGFCLWLVGFLLSSPSLIDNTLTLVVFILLSDVQQRTQGWSVPLLLPEPANEPISRMSVYS